MSELSLIKRKENAAKDRRQESIKKANQRRRLHGVKDIQIAPYFRIINFNTTESFNVMAAGSMTKIIKKVMRGVQDSVEHDGNLRLEIGLYGAKGTTDSQVMGRIGDSIVAVTDIDKIIRNMHGSTQAANVLKAG